MNGGVYIFIYIFKLVEFQTLINMSNVPGNHSYVTSMLMHSSH